MKFYDRENKRLILVQQKATSRYWDRHWQTNDLAKKITSGKDNLFLKKFTRKLLEPGSKILEGGCGIGQNVYGLTQWGYRAWGVDFAKETVRMSKQGFPSLSISVQDVRRLIFPDSFFDGYWSLGVIEHFWNGHNKILNEAQRVIKPGGYLFLTFPYMNALRKLKAKMRLYTGSNEDYRINLENFYQFILDKKSVISAARGMGFSPILGKSFDATKGLKDEISVLRPILQRIYDSQSILFKGVRFLISILFSKIAGHMVLLIFQKKK